MKKIALIALATASLGALATPAAAQTTTGTVNITGTVAAKCFVVTGAGTDSTFGTTVALGELAGANGTLATDLASRFATTGGSGLSAKVVCTSAAPTIAVDADPLQSATGAPSGYANRVDFTANVAVDTVTTTGVPFANSSTAAPLAATPIGGRLANSANNIRITASNFATPAATDLLVAATDYSGKIVVTIAPGA